MIPARPTLHRHALRAAGFFAALASLSTAGCYFSDEGLSPPSRALYFPTGLAVSPGRSALYVANSDFDLQYNGGTVQVVDLGTARGALGRMLDGIRCTQQSEDACAAWGVPVSEAPPLQEVCNGIAFRGGGGLPSGAGSKCTVAVECASGVCADGVCTDCKSSADCAGGGTCAKGVCVLSENRNTSLTPSACTAMAPPFAANGATFATIGAFASGAVLAVNDDRVCEGTSDPCLRDSDCAGGKCVPREGARLFVPVRGDPSISWFDVVDDRMADASDVSRLDCGQQGNEKRCDDKHRMGVDPYDNFRSLALPVEPVGLDVSDDGTTLVSAHQIASTPSIGLSVNEWITPEEPSPPRPTFQFSLSSGVPAGPTEVARVPVPALVARTQKGLAGAGVAPINYQPGFLVTYNASAQLDLYRYNDDAVSSPPRPFLTRAAATGINTNADGKDSRGIVVDPTNRKACERDCPAGAGLLACLRACVDIPLDVYIANRAPASLLRGRVRTVIADSDQGGSVGSGASDSAEVFDVEPLTVGPSKVALGQVIGMDGQLHRRIFVVAFDTKRVYAYDPEGWALDFTINTGRGPHAIAFDTCIDDDCADGESPHSYLYVGHFTDSYLGVVDLDMRHPETFGIMFASIGTPTPPRDSK